jgi:hypothetical protein
MNDVLKHANELVDDFRGNKTCSCEFCERASEILPELVAECERLQENQCTPEKCYGEVARLSSELTRWQKIAAKAAATASKAIETTDVDWHKMVSEEDIQQAARELGIAAGDHIHEPTKMVLTEEQRAALVSTCQIFQSAIDSESGKPLSEQVMLLVGINSTIGVMLDQSQPAWEITEERRIALGSVRMLLDALALKPTGSWDKERAVLRVMLEE